MSDQHYVITLAVDGKVTRTLHRMTPAASCDELVVIYEETDATLTDTLLRRRLAVAFTGTMHRMWQTNPLCVGESVMNFAQVVGLPRYEIKVTREADLPARTNQPATSQLTNA